MQLHPAFEFTLTLTRAELRIVGLALAGRLKDGKDQEAARGLNESLLEHRRRLLLDELDVVEGAQEKT